MARRTADDDSMSFKNLFVLSSKTWADKRDEPELNGLEKNVAEFELVVTCVRDTD